MKKLFCSLLLIIFTLTPCGLHARHCILNANVKSLQVVVNDDWMSPPVMALGSSDVLHVGFDELSHNFHRYIYRLEHCEADWTPTEGLFDSDWLQGFNDLPVEEYENSLNTTVLYTHYRLQIPNEQCRPILSGNYRLHVIDEEADEEVLIVEFRIVEPVMQVGLAVTTNTDVDQNKSHQQVSMTVNYNKLQVTRPDDQIRVFVMQNGREDNMKEDPRPTYITPKGLQWEHASQLIFEAGNEYHKFEMLDVSHPTMGLAHVAWDDEGGRYHAIPFFCEPRRNYVYDEDADGAFYIRNSDNMENDRLSDYVLVHYRLSPAPLYNNANIIIDGNWTTEAPENYVMDYDPTDQSYNAVILQKQGYYNYQLLIQDADGTTHIVPEEGSFYQTENRYQALVYYKGTGERTWRLTGYQQVVFKGI